MRVINMTIRYCDECPYINEGDFHIGGISSVHCESPGQIGEEPLYLNSIDTVKKIHPECPLERFTSTTVTSK